MRAGAAPVGGEAGRERHRGHIEPAAHGLKVRDRRPVEVDLLARAPNDADEEIEAGRHREREALEQGAVDGHRQRQARLAVHPLRHEDGVVGADEEAAGPDDGPVRPRREGVRLR
jgi:hypothetical protein